MPWRTFEHGKTFNMVVPAISGEQGRSPADLHGMAAPCGVYTAVVWTQPG
jgi:hypothetical protein